MDICLEGVIKIAESKYKYLIKNVLLFSIGTFGTKAISFILIPLYTNYISTSEYGIIDIISTTDWILIYILTLGSVDGFLRFSLESTNELDDLFVFTKKIILIGFAILSSLMFVFKDFLPRKYASYHYVFLIAVFILNALNDLILSYYKAKGNTEKVVISGLIASVVNLLISITTIVFFHMAGVGYYLALCGGFFVSILYGFFNIKKDNFIRIKDKVTIGKKKEILFYSIPLAVNAISLWINNALDKYFILIMHGEDANGIYSAAFKIPAIMTILQTAFIEAWSLSSIKEYDDEDSDGFFKNAYVIFNAFLFIACSLIIMLNVLLTHILCLKGFSEAWRYSAFLLISVVYTALCGFLSGPLGALKLTTSLAGTTFMAAMINIALNIILIPQYKTYGASIATVISCCVMFIVRCIVVSKKSNIRLPYWRSLIFGILLFVQAAVEQIEGHCYIVQVIIFITLLVINRKELLKIFTVILKYKRSRKND